MSRQSKSPFAHVESVGRIALGLVLPILLGFFLGNYLDERLDSTPWLTLILLILGISAGFGWLYRVVTRDEDSK